MDTTPQQPQTNGAGDQTPEDDRQTRFTLARSGENQWLGWRWREDLRFGEDGGEVKFPEI